MRPGEPTHHTQPVRWWRVDVNDWKSAPHQAWFTSSAAADRYSHSEALEDWAAWLAAHDAEVAAQALREAAGAPIPRAALNTRSNGLRQWLRARADRIERGE